MGRVLKYKPGSHYRVDDRTGFPQRAERTREEWTGMIVGRRVWEPRQPQDKVRTVPDLQAAPRPRPLSQDTFVGPYYVQVASTGASIGATVLPVVDTSRLSIGMTVRVVLQSLDGGASFVTSIASIAAGASVTLSSPLPAPAIDGDMVMVIEPVPAQEAVV